MPNIHEEIVQTTSEKAQSIHNDFGKFEDGKVIPGTVNYRGSIAEVGAGQEIARPFFEALGTAKTIIKTMSAFGKGFSDSIYGRTPGGQPYISEDRLKQMIDHEYTLLVERSLAPGEEPRDQTLRYFAFANTVDISEHGWAGVRVQVDNDSKNREGHDVLEFRIHFNSLGFDKVSKMRVVGALGVNLIHAALLRAEGKLSDRRFVQSLVDNVEVSEIRIDSIVVERLSINVTAESKGVFKMSHAGQVEPDKYAQASQALSIELVKSALVHCAAFQSTKKGAVGAYYAFNYLPVEVTGKPNSKDPRPLLLTRSACDDGDLVVEQRMLQAAKVSFAKDVSREYLSPIPESSIQTAIQLPILSVSNNSNDIDIYIDRANEPASHFERRTKVLEETDTEELSRRVTRITNTGSTALLTEFLNTSEIVKYFRTWTRLKPKEQSKFSQEAFNIAFVFRTDHFIELMMNIKEHVIDRDILELVGSVTRRKTRLYIYPCNYQLLLTGGTRYGSPLRSAFRELSTLERRAQQGLAPAIADLSRELTAEYAAIIEYYMADDMISMLPQLSG